MIVRLWFGQVDGKHGVLAKQETICLILKERHILEVKLGDLESVSSQPFTF